MVGKTGVHSQGTFLQATGFQSPGFPGAGCWVSYGLGSLNENLPTFVVMPDHRGYASNGTKNWDSAFLPGQHQGTVLYPGRDKPIADLFPGKRAGFVTKAIGRRHAEGAGATEQAACEGPRRRRPARRAHPQLRTRGEDAARRARRRSTSRRRPRRPAQALRPRPRQGDVRQGDQPARRDGRTSARKCLTARRLLERGVRFVQIWSGNDNGFPRRNWDSHEDVKRDHGPLAFGMAKGASALIQDLKRTGLLEDTIVLWTTEFGRMPSSQGGKGRDHNPYCFTNWLCGGGIKGGVTVGESDDFGYKPADRKKPTEVYDIHATILHLLGIDHAKLTVRHNGIDRRLTDVHGHVIQGLLA